MSCAQIKWEDARKHHIQHSTSLKLNANGNKTKSCFPISGPAGTKGNSPKPQYTTVWSPLRSLSCRPFAAWGEAALRAQGQPRALGWCAGLGSLTCLTVSAGCRAGGSPRKNAADSGVTYVQPLGVGRVAALLSICRPDREKGRAQLQHPRGKVSRNFLSIFFGGGQLNI